MGLGGLCCAEGVCALCLCICACNSVGLYGSYCFFSCDVWSVCSHEVRPEEKGELLGDEMRREDGQDIREKGYFNTGLVWFFFFALPHLPHDCFLLLTPGAPPPRLYHTFPSRLAAFQLNS